MDVEDRYGFQLENCIKYILPYKVEFLSRYLKDIHREISSDGIGKAQFYEFMDIPIFLAEKLFKLFDEDCDSILSLEEFINGFLRLCNPSTTVKFIFDFLDLDRDGIILFSDIKLYFTYFLKKFSKYEELETKIASICYDMMIKNETLNYFNFSHMIMKNNSDLFFNTLIFLIKCLPFGSVNINFYKRDKRVRLEKENMTDNRKELNEYKKIYPPSRLDLFFDEELCDAINMFKDEKEFFNISNNFNYISLDDMENEISKLDCFYNDIRPAGSKIKSTFNETSENLFEGCSIQKKGEINKIEAREYKERSTRSFTTTTTTIPHPREDFEVYMDKNIEISHEDYLYKYDKIKNKLKKVYICLIGNEIYYLNNSKKSKLKGMHYLKTLYTINEEFDDNSDAQQLEISGQGYYYFSLYLNNKNRIFLTDDHRAYVKWKEMFKKVLKYKEPSENYEFLENLYVGNSTCVKKALNKITNEMVSIKIYSKKNLILNTQKQQMLLREKDILTNSRNKNVVSLIEAFEDINNFYMVYEYLSNGDLYKFTLNNPNWLFSSKLDIIKQICIGINHLHSLGVVHRDIKPQNICLSSEMTAKIIDFEFSTVIGESEKLSDPYGTLLFASPEILLKRKYSKKIDIWGLGLTIYLIIFGKLLFDDEKALADMIDKHNLDEFEIIIKFDPFLNSTKTTQIKNNNNNNNNNIIIHNNNNNNNNERYFSLLQNLILECLVDEYFRYDINKVLIHEIFN